MAFNILSILVAIITLIGLMVFHEFGHFFIAKRRGVKIEEFGIGYPPRLFGKKFGETIYSLNLIPFGAFVKIYGEEGGVEDYRSFSGKKIWERVLIVLGGVIAFWIISAILLIIVFGLGTPTPVEDNVSDNLINPRVQITAVALGSPAAMAGLEPFDTILSLKSGEEQLKTDKTEEIIKFVNNHKGEEVTLTIQRWGKSFDVSLTPRAVPPAGEGPLGVGLTRMALVPSPWYKAPYEGVKACGRLTVATLESLGSLVVQIIYEREVPAGVTMMGPLGLFDFLKQAFQLGINYFLYFVALISVYLAIFNLFPIPALDGGKLLFLAIEAIRKKPVPQKIEQNVTTAFFVSLIILMIFVTIKFDIPKVF